MSRKGHVRRLNKASSAFFFIGAAVSKLQLLPILFLPAVCYILSSLLYLIGFTLWIIANDLAPTNPRKKNKWYGFAQYKNQYIFSALVGACAIALGMIGIFFPIGLVLAAWLYVFCQLVWVIAEYHKYKNPPITDPSHSSSKQGAYLRMSVFLTLIGVITATATTLVFIFPPFAMLILLAATVLCLIVNLGAVEAWLSFQFDNHVPDIIDVTPDELQPENDMKVSPSIENSAQCTQCVNSVIPSPRTSLNFFPKPPDPDSPFANENNFSKMSP